MQTNACSTSASPLDVGERFKNHRQHKSWWLAVASITLEHFATRADLEDAERVAIAAEGPLHNRQRTFRSPVSRESTQRQRKHNPEQRKCFTAIRRYAHQDHDGSQVRWCVQRAVDAGVSRDDIDWALAHPSYAPPS